MHKIYVTGIILLNSYCNVKSVSVCDKVLRKKGYIGVIETAKREFNPAAMTTPNSVCEVGRKFSNKLFTDPAAWLCLGNIVQMINDNMALYKASVDKCNVKNRFTDIACGNFAYFQICIRAKMRVTLQGLASGEGWDQNSCIKCREYSDFKLCVTKGKLDTKCPPSTRNVLNMTFARKSCIACKQQATRSTTKTPRTAEPPSSTKSPKYNRIVVGIVVGVVCSLIILIGVVYVRYKTAKLDRELAEHAGTLTSAGSQISLTGIEKGDENEDCDASLSVSSNSSSRGTDNSSKRKRRKRRK